MTFNEITTMISQYKRGGTNQHWRKDSDMSYKNEYIELLRIDTSNVSGGELVQNGKQWSIIIKIKKPFEHLPNWKTLANYYGEDFALTTVNKGRLKGNYGIRFYHMSQNPTNDMIKMILDYIFEY